MAAMKRILITGAAGRLGAQLRAGLKPHSEVLRLCDVEDMGAAAPHEEIIQCDLTDKDAALEATRDVDAIVHFAGLPREGDFDEMFESHVRPSYHMFEGARRHGVRRVVYASSVHAIGFYALEDNIDVSAPPRPDTFYGVAKCTVEAMARLYWDKYGVESACLRIFSSIEEPADRRMLWSWLSYGDCVRLVESALTAPRLGATIAYGLSDNREKPVSNREAGHLGFTPRDSAEPFREAVEARTQTPDPKALETRTLGGWFCALPHPDDAQ